MSCSRRGSHLLHGNDCRPVVYVVASVEDLDAIAHLGRAELGRGRRRGPPGRRPRPASWIFRCHGGFFIMLAAVGPGATILVLAPGLSTWWKREGVQGYGGPGVRERGPGVRTGIQGTGGVQGVRLLRGYRGYRGTGEGVRGYSTVPIGQGCVRFVYSLEIPDELSKICIVR